MVVDHCHTAIYTLSKEVNVVFKLQSKLLLVSQQAAGLENLATILCAHIIIDGPFAQEEIALINTTLNTTFGRWSISNENFINWILDQGMFIQETWDKLSVESIVDAM